MTRKKLISIGLDENDDSIELESGLKDVCLYYAGKFENGQITQHGMQCAFNGDTADYEKIMTLLDEIADRIHEINEISKPEIGIRSSETSDKAPKQEGEKNE